MSRAFVDEDASADGANAAPEVRIPLPPGSRNYLTPEGARRLNEELSSLVETQRPATVSAIARLESGSDSSELDTIAMLRQRLATIDRRIEYPGRMASIAEVVEYHEGRSDHVVFGSGVRVEDEGQGERYYRIVGVDESDPEAGRLSWRSPIARALIGRKAGEAARVQLPGMVRILRILSID